ncbi:hypothetical protein BTA51_03245 [Hahella sp. CCB-MM4]|nr:hypothetical protein BTA51_03245 [Hahella sp. CCB-MM4]
MSFAAVLLFSLTFLLLLEVAAVPEISGVTLTDIVIRWPRSSTDEWRLSLESGVNLVNRNGE